MSEIKYKEEQEKLEAFKPQEGSLFWKPEPGQHKVKALAELEEAEPYEDKPQAKIKLLIADEEKTWTFGVGKSLASTYGQIVALASKRNGNLKDTEFVVVVVNDGTKNSYTIVG